MPMFKPMAHRMLCSMAVTAGEVSAGLGQVKPLMSRSSNMRRALRSYLWEPMIFILDGEGFLVQYSTSARRFDSSCERHPLVQECSVISWQDQAFRPLVVNRDRGAARSRQAGTPGSLPASHPLFLWFLFRLRRHCPFIS